MTDDGKYRDVIMWKELVNKIIQANDDCSICLCNMFSNVKQRDVDVLSCGHAFHSRCIEAMESMYHD